MCIFVPGQCKANFFLQQHHKKIAKITPKKPSTGGSKYPAPISIPNIIDTDCGLTNIHLHHLGALVSAGFEVSAIVGENILNTDRIHTSTSARTKGNKDNFEGIVAGLDMSGDGSFSAVSETWNTDGNSTKKRFYQTAQSFSEEQKQQQQLEQPNQVKEFLSRSLVEHAHSRNSTMQYSAGENPNREHNVAYECNNESAETHSIDIMKPINICFDAQTTNTNDEAGTTMAERDVGSTFLLPHTHLYKSDMQTPN
ncbi:uncharacterized protein LOC129250758 [Anastrepha obliqua]|uniref:uncharacterized protein LOC129250758 n=1 Tax=Anastrepha obliqua TaxID=95512 RepID=UPI0024093493|nr:uncharacterized protein LOC129250758 [Anastrepha obliqua]